jgi:Holliday junction DNA helicase RuvB
MKNRNLPKFVEIVGNAAAKKSIIESVIVAKQESKPIPNILAVGSSGCGKTTLAKATARLIGADFHEFLAKNIDTRIKDFIDELKLMEDHDTLIFLDEIHQLSTVSQECLYPVLDSKHIAIFGATTDTGKLSRPFQNRFQIHIEIQSYSIQDSIEIIDRYCTRSEYKISTISRHHIAMRSRGIPRTIEHHIDMIWNKVLFKIAMGETDKKLITESTTLEYFAEKGIDKKGLTKQEQNILIALKKYGILSLTALSSICEIDEEQIKKIYEPYLLCQKLIRKTPRGRTLTAEGISHVILK